MNTSCECPSVGMISSKTKKLNILLMNEFSDKNEHQNSFMVL